MTRVFKEKLAEQIKQNQNKRIMFWGASLLLEEFINEQNLCESNILGIVDKNSSRWGQKFGIYEIMPPDCIKELKPDAIIISVFASYKERFYDIYKYIKETYPDILVLSNLLDTNELLCDIKDLQDVQKEIKNKQEQNFSELLHAQIFNNLINNSSWVKQRDFVPIKGSANYTFLYLLYMIYENIQPKNILELGIGQTSKLSSQYTAYKNRFAKLTLVEHDEHWIKSFSKQIVKNINTKLVKRDIEKFEHNGTLNERYADFKTVINNNKYDLVIVDGPYGYNSEYSRTNVLDVIPDNLAKDFIIVFDDAERVGEQNTIKMLLEKLDTNGIKYCYQYKVGLKKQLLIASENYQHIAFY